MTASESPQTVRLRSGPRIQLDECQLRQLDGLGAGRQVPLNDRMVVGAATDCDLQLQTPGVSRQHFAVAPDAGCHTITDLASTNGTFVNGVRVREALLSPGNTIEIAGITFRYEPISTAVVADSMPATPPGLVGQSNAMRNVFAAIHRVADSNTTVVLQGETGTGKGAVARAFHQLSDRRDGPFEVLDCGVVAANLVESDLFGHVRGAFTGAVSDRRGLLEAAAGGTLLIDEVSDLPLELQPKLLRVLEEGEFRRLGAQRSTRVTCRIVAATQHDLWDETEAGRFRHDLFFRLSVVTIPLPALRHRRDDLPLLTDHFFAEYGKGTRFADLPASTRDAMLEHPWPGNLRELRNVIEQLAIDAVPRLAPPAAPAESGESTEAEPLVPFSQAKQDAIAAFERLYFEKVMQVAGANISRGARVAQMDRKYFRSLLLKHNLLTKDE